MKVGLLIGIPLGLAVGVTHGLTSGVPHTVASAFLVLLGMLFAAIIAGKIFAALLH